QHLLDAGDGRQRLDLELLLVADDADDGALLAAADVRLEPQFADALLDVLDLFRGGVGLEDDDHGGAGLPRVSESPGRPAPPGRGPGARRPFVPVVCDKPPPSLWQAPRSLDRGG